MEFRSGYFEYTKQPQWETQNKIIKGKFDLFVKHIESDEKTWMYFDYKYLNSFLLNTSELRNVLNSSSFCASFSFINFVGYHMEFIRFSRGYIR